MFISRLDLNIGNRQVVSEIARPYEMHRTLLRAFTNLADGEGRILFRVDQYQDGFPVALVVSHTLPDWSVLKDTYTKTQPQCKPYEPQLETGGLYQFRLRTRPSVKKSEHGARQGKRVAVLAPAAQEEWLQRKGEQHGFAVAGVIPKEDVWYDTRNGENVRQPCVVYDGSLKVMDAVLLQEALYKGIGPQKAYGFGLLTLARPI